MQSTDLLRSSVSAQSGDLVFEGCFVFNRFWRQCFVELFLISRLLPSFVIVSFCSGFTTSYYPFSSLLSMFSFLYLLFLFYVSSFFPPFLLLSSYSVIFVFVWAVLSPVVKPESSRWLSAVSIDRAPYSVQVYISLHGDHPYFEAYQLRLVHYLDDRRFTYDKRINEEQLTGAGAWERRWKCLGDKVATGLRPVRSIGAPRLCTASKSTGTGPVW